MSEWISVKDRLPDDCDSVLIYSPGFDVTGAYLIYDEKKSPICWQVNDWDETDSSLSCNDVTHWMHPPSAPAREVCL